MTYLALSDLRALEGDPRLAPVYFEAGKLYPLLTLIPWRAAPSAAFVVKVMSSTPTSSWGDADDSYSSTTAGFSTRTFHCQRIYSQPATGAFAKSPAMVAQQLRGAGNSLGEALSDVMLAGNKFTVTVDALASASGVVSFLPCEQHDVSSASVTLTLDFNDSTDLIKLSNDSGATYGDTVASNTYDLVHFPIYTATDSLFGWISWDKSAAEGKGSWNKTIVCAKSKAPAGLIQQLDPDKIMWAAGSAGDVVVDPTAQDSDVSLSMLDKLVQLAPQIDRTRAVYVMAPATLANLKSAIGSAAFVTLSEYMGQPFAIDQIAYNGIPVVTDSALLGWDEQVGGLEYNMIVLVELSDDGLSMFYHNAFQADAQGIASTEVGPANLPFRVVVIGESETANTSMYRVDCMVAPVLANKAKAAAIIGVTN